MISSGMSSSTRLQSLRFKSLIGKTPLLPTKSFNYHQIFLESLSQFKVSRLLKQTIAFGAWSMNVPPMSSMVRDCIVPKVKRIWWRFLQPFKLRVWSDINLQIDVGRLDSLVQSLRFNEVKWAISPNDEGRSCIKVPSRCRV